jgi:HEPN domain-containing protein
LKAVVDAGGARSVIGYSVAGLLTRVAGEHPELEALRDPAAELDLFYIATRYPNGLIEGVPYQAFTQSQAERALSAGARFLVAVEGVLAAAADGR